MTPSNDQITTWISRLDAELAGDDPALRRDAVGDATDHLTAEYEQLGPGASPEAVSGLLEAYGDPIDVADSYRAAERLLGGAPRATPVTAALPAATTDRAPAATADTPAPAIAASPTAGADQADRPARWFGVVADPHAWSSLLYMLLALPLGIAWFTWTVTGVSVSAGLLVLIVGIPIALVFLATIRGIALLDGRIVEALLGERMPRRTLPTPRDTKGVIARVKYWLADARTWTSLVYLLLMLPLGIAYFTAAVSVAAASLSLAGAPVLLAIAQVDGNVDVDAWMWIVSTAMVPAGILGVFGLLHLARAIGGLHGRFAKAMLVGGEGRAHRRDPVAIPGSIGRAAVFLVVAALVGGIGFGASAAYIRSQSERVTQVLRATDVATLRMDLATVDVGFSVDDQLGDGDMRVEASGRVYDDEDASARKLVQLDGDGSVTTLRAECPDDVTILSFGCDIEVTVFVAADSSIALRGKNDTGDITFLDARFDTVDIETNTGDIEGRVDAGRISLRSDTGDVELELGDRARSIDVEGDTGDIELTVVGAWRIDARTDTGDREIMSSDAASDRRLRIATDTGDIEVQRADFPRGDDDRDDD